MLARVVRGVIAAVLVLFGAAALAEVRAQSLDDWTAPYRPAMLPGYAGDMARFADAPRYALDLTLEVSADRVVVEGQQTVIYTNRAAVPLPDIVFRLYPNLESYGGTMTVSRAAVDGAPVVPGLDATRSVLTLALAQPLAPGAQVTIELAFTAAVTRDVARLYAQFSYLDGVLALPNLYPLLSVYTPGQGWWQTTDQPQGDAVFSETSFYQVAITAPERLILAASGSRSSLADNGDGTLTHSYVAPLMREFALFASEDYVTYTGEQDGVTINLYFDPEDQEAARAGLRMTKDAVRVFNAVYGGYPFAELDVIQTPTTAGGIEYPGVFVVTADIWVPDDSYFEWVIVHEAAHQWFYSLVGSDQTRHPWMDEALAQYSVALYIRDLEGPDAYAGAVEFFREQYEFWLDEHEDQPIGGPVIAYPEQAYFYMVYQKGPLLYAALADHYGVDRVAQMLHDYFTAYRYAIAQPDDMLASYEASLGDDLDAVFAEWVGEFPVG